MHSDVVSCVRTNHPRLFAHLTAYWFGILFECNGVESWSMQVDLSTFAVSCVINTKSFWADFHDFLVRFDCNVQLSRASIIHEYRVFQKGWYKLALFQISPVDFIVFLFSDYGCKIVSILISVEYHLLFQHNQLFYLPYMAVAEISMGISLRVRPEEPFLLLKYIITLSLILCSYY